MNSRTKVTVACKACQKKKVKCTGVSPCANCIRANQRCEFTGTAKKRGPRNGNVEIIKSSARRIENVLQKNPNLRGQIEQMLAHRPTARSARPAIPADAPIVIIDDDTGVITNASQSHGIPHGIPRSHEIPRSHQEQHVAQENELHLNNGHETFNPQSPVLRRPIPIYPVTSMHVATMHGPTRSKTTLPPITELETPDIQHHGHITQITNTSSNNRTLPAPNFDRKKATPMPINSSGGIEILLPPAPELANPLDSAAMLINNPPLMIHDKPPNFMPSPPSSASSMTSSPGYYNIMAFKKYQSDSPPTPTNSSPPLSPRNASLLSRPVAWEYSNRMRS
ncbi:hypothetical protein C1645_731240 [Glomus cerebriforme]|uniref:Zn(2)-C6 fungal-type domain-containing protein n=1 Tax=Glomus cerebriforme TaxID=658196 RepID=A0A397TNM2_9GLOM|nr:hypothetical protein C1645_731240 [Glomus cerebriforme]